VILLTFGLSSVGVCIFLVMDLFRFWLLLVAFWSTGVCSFEVMLLAIGF
jgi:hypothetical protein